MALRIRHLASLVLASLLLLSFALVYWQILRAPELEARTDNPRRVEFEQRLVRGRILDRNGTELAGTDVVNGIAVRRYAYPLLGPVIGYHSIRYGEGGLEAALNTQLRGEASTDALARLLSQINHRPQKGNDVVLTLDLKLQEVADRALGNRAGAVVALDPRTGAALAMASHPSFNPNTLDQNFDQIKQDSRGLMLNRATQARYPPGSVFKTVTLSAGIDSGRVKLSDVVQDGDRTLTVDGFQIRCNNNPPGVNQFDIAHAFAYSCNLTFAEMALNLGLQRYRDYATRFMFGRQIPFELPVAVSQLANDPAAINRVLLAETGFGQGELLLTPLHLALIAAAVANDGVMPEPYIVSEVRAPDSPAPPPHGAVPLSNVIAPGPARAVRDAMVVAVQDGYGRSAAIPGVRVAAKTGTAQLGGSQEPHAVFIAFAPADAPKVAVAVLVENSGEGSVVAGPIARQVLQAALK